MVARAGNFLIVTGFNFCKKLPAFGTVRRDATFYRCILFDGLDAVVAGGCGRVAFAAPYRFAAVGVIAEKVVTVFLAFKFVKAFRARLARISGARHVVVFLFFRLGRSFRRFRHLHRNAESIGLGDGILF